MFVQTKAFNAIPGAVEVFIATLVHLHPLAVELFLDDEFVITHFLDCILNLSRRSLAQHGCKRVEELNFLVLGRRVSETFCQ